jgi:endonuclease/exonuclease/phosphatase family metal-dependent hydrolase
MIPRMLCRAILCCLLLPAQVAIAQGGAIINVATYNLRYNTPQDGINAWPHRREAVKALIRYHDFDVFGTQEVLADQIADLKGMSEYAHVGAGRDDGKSAGEHSAIFYKRGRFSAVQHGDFWLSETPDRPSLGWDAKCCNRITSWVQLRDTESGKSFFVFSVHFDHEGIVARRESAQLLTRRIDEIAADSPVICVGDFNATPGTEPIATMRGTLRDAYDISMAPPYGPVGTYNGFQLDAPMTDRIDYIFVSRNVKVLRYAVLSDSIDGRRYPSDHHPVVARVLRDRSTGSARYWRRLQSTPLSAAANAGTRLLAIAPAVSAHWPKHLVVSSIDCVPGRFPVDGSTGNLCEPVQ